MGEVIVERDQVAAAADDLVRAIVERRGGALFLVGAPGVGKTTALGTVCDRARASGVEVVVGRAAAAESALPYGVIDRAVGLQSAPSTEDPTERRAKVLRDRAPALLAIDDLHWADADSLALVGYLARRVGRLAVGLVATLRPWPPPAREAAEALAAAAEAGLLRLEPLSTEGTASFLASVVGEPVADAHELTGGNPLLLVHLASSGHPSSRTARRLVLARLAGVSRPARAYLDVAAVAGPRFRPAVVAAVAGLDDHQAAEVLGELCHSELVEADGPGWARFSQPLLATLVSDEIPGPVRATVHATLMRALVAAGYSPTEAAPHALNGHHVGDPDAVAVLELASKEAARRGARTEAINHLSAAVELAGTNATTAMRLGLARLRLAHGDVETAITELTALADLAGPAAEVTRALAEALCLAGRNDEAVRRCLEAADLVADPAAAADVLLEQAYTVFRSAGPARALPLAARARQLVRSGAEGKRQQADARWGYLAALSGDPAAAAVVEAAKPTIGADGDAATWYQPGTVARLLAFANTARLQGRFDDAEAAYRTLATRADAPAGGLTASYATALLASMLAGLGRLDEALALAEAARAMGDTLPMTRTVACAASAEAESLRGDPDRARGWLDEGRATATATNDWCAMLRLLAIDARLRDLAGRPDDASAAYLEVEALNTRLGIAEPCFVPWGRDAVAAHLRAGRPDDAERVAGWLAGRAAALPCRWPSIAAHAAAAAVLEHRGDLAQAAAEHTQALDLHHGAAMPLERVRTLIGAGAFARRHGSPAHARRLLGEAARDATELGAGALARQAGEELAAAGGRRRARRDADTLTPQEARVARLAAAGRTNAEIGRQLFVSPKTVETHLQRAYSKLGVKGRRELIGAPDLVPGNDQ